VQDAIVSRTTPDYFRTFGIPLTGGRFYQAADRADAAPVAVIGEALARRFWPGRDPIGARITFDDPTDSAATWRTIVGVVGDVRQEGPASPSYPQIYLPLSQVSGRSLLVALRTAGDPLALATPLKHAVAVLDPALAVGQVATMEERLAASVARPRVNAVLLGGFAATALLLAMVGIYGVIAFTVVQRTKEVGVRMALGAQREDVLRLVLRTALAPVLAGTALGVVAAAAGSRLLRSLLFGVSTTDPVTFALVAALLLSVALLASYLPARRATRVDPVIALRSE
jgi:putative ABC transport system permease protein